MLCIVSSVVSALIGLLSLCYNGLLWLYLWVFKEQRDKNAFKRRYDALEGGDMFSIILQRLLWLGVKILLMFQSISNCFKGLTKSKKCEPIRNRLLLYNAHQLSEKIRKGELKSVDVVKAYISRIQTVNPLLNAIVDERFNTAYEEAKAADDFVVNGGLTEEELAATKPLLGVPITVKESIAVKGLLIATSSYTMMRKNCSSKGMTNNAGCLKTSFQRGRAKEDAEIVRQVREAGGIVLAVTNTPELCMNWETNNKITGTTCNPYNLKKTPGGSSGGEAALLASAGSLIGLGSDIGGSLRIPAHFAGIWGHKPSPGAVSNKGHYPTSPDAQWDDVFTLGPMARYAVDLPLLLNLILKPDVREELQLHKEVPIKDIKLYYMVDNGGSYLTNGVSKSIQEAMKSVVMYLGSTHGVHATKIDIKLLKHSIKMSYPALMSLQSIENIFEDKGKGSWAEFFKFLTCRSDASFNTIMYGVAQNFLSHTSVLERNTQEGEDMLSVLRQEFQTILGDNGVLLYPTHPNTAFYHGQVVSKALDMTYCAVFNTLGLPVTNCPICLDSSGMPIGLQVVANKNNDRLTLAVAKAIEQGFGGWQPPPSSGTAPVVIEDWS